MCCSGQFYKWVSIVRLRLDLPQPIVPIFWGLFFLEATFGAYLSVWPLWIEQLGASVTIVGLVLGSSGFIRLLVIAPSASIADRLGYRRAILISRSITAVGLHGPSPFDTLGGQRTEAIRLDDHG